MKLFLIFIFIYINLNAFEMKEVLNLSLEIMEKYNEKDSITKDIKIIKEENDYQQIKSNSFVDKFISNKQCSQILNKFYYLNCYDYNLKSSKFVYYKIEKDKLKTNIEEKLQFYPDIDLTKKQSSEVSDYVKNKYHMNQINIVPHEVFSHNIKALKSTYLNSNSIPLFNMLKNDKNSWLGLINYEKQLVNDLDEVNVLVGIEYSKNPRVIGKNKISIPDGFWKIIFNDKKNFKRCFYIENKEQENQKIDKYEIDCKKII